MVDLPPGVGDEQPSRTRRLNPRAVRTLGVLILVAVVVDLVVQNSERTTIRFLFITGHVRVIWVIVVCLVVAGAVGYLTGRRGRRRRRRRRSSSE
jgi:uncharacterized integral membrane protein